MRTKKGFELRELCGEQVIVGQGVENIDFSKIISMNSSAALLWKNVVDKEFTADDLAKIPRRLPKNGLRSELLRDNKKKRSRKASLFFRFLSVFA